MGEFDRVELENRGRDAIARFFQDPGEELETGDVFLGPLPMPVLPPVLYVGYPSKANAGETPPVGPLDLEADPTALHADREPYILTQVERVLAAVLVTPSCDVNDRQENFSLLPITPIPEQVLKDKSKLTSLYRDNVNALLYVPPHPALLRIHGGPAVGFAIHFPKIFLCGGAALRAMKARRFASVRHGYRQKVATAFGRYFLRIGMDEVLPEAVDRELAHFKAQQQAQAKREGI